MNFNIALNALQNIILKTLILEIKFHGLMK